MNLNFPSFKEISSGSIATFKRFPAAMLTAVSGTVLAIWLSELSSSKVNEYYFLFHVAFLCALGISFFIALTTFGESKGWDFKRIMLLRGAGLLTLLLYYLTFPDVIIVEEPYFHIYRYLLLLLASHLLVAVAPFLGNRDLGEFWGYNKALFLNILISALYSAVLYLGLTIALLSVDVLLNISVDENTYFQLWMFMAGVFNTWFFLARVPKPGHFDREVTSYPKGLKVFVQYVLIPLVTVYIVILYLYMIKIIIQWELPQGWVANLVLSFSIAGILSLLLLYPIQEKEGNKWMKVYSKSYFYGLIPLMILLYISIWTRISEYGVTINRFFVATLAVWLSGIVVYFILSKAKNIKVIPASLLVVVLLISCGPMGAFSVSERSQKGRLSEILVSYDYLDEEGMIQASTQDIPIEDRRQVSSIVHYLHDNHGLSALQSYFDFDLEKRLDEPDPDSLGYRSDEHRIVEWMGIEYTTHRWPEVSTVDEENFSFRSNTVQHIDIRGYDILIPEVFISGYQSTVNRQSYTFDYDLESQELVIREYQGDGELRIELLPFVQSLYERFGNQKELSRSMMTLKAEHEKFAVAIILSELHGNLEDTLSVSSLTFHALISEK